MATSPEQLLISAILREEAFGQVAEQGIDQRHFISRLAEWQFLEDYYGRYRKTPSRLVFRSSFPDFAIKPVNDVDYYVDELKRHYTRRLLTSSMKDVADFITDGRIDVAIERMREGVVMVASETMPGEDGDIFSVNDDVLKEVEGRYERFRTLGASGIPTGIPIVDEYTGGMGPNEHWIVAARQGNGKSFLLQYMATNASMNGHNVLFAALEQTRPQVSMRIFSMMSALIGHADVFKSEQLMRGKGYDLKAFGEFVREMHQVQIDNGFGKLVVADQQRSRITPITLSSLIEKHDPDIVFVDYIQLMNQNRFSGPQGLAAVVEEITAITNSKQIPVVSASQLNRDAAYAAKDRNGSDAGTENLSGSDQLGNDATVVLTLKQLSPSVAYLKNVKNRYGVGGWSSHIEFRPDAGILKPISEERALDLIDEDAFTQKQRNASAPKTFKFKGQPSRIMQQKRKLKKLQDGKTI